MNMRNIDRIFILTGAFFAVAGMCTGLWMVAVNSFVYSKIHAHINLLGWVSLAIYGVVYRIYPAMKDCSLALTHLICSVAGVIFMNLGWWMFLQNILVGTKILVVIFRGGSALGILGVVLFLVIFWLHGKDRPEAG